MPKHPIIGFAGMSHLGLVSATAAAHKGFTVVCFDANADLIADINSGNLPVAEPQLDDLVAKNNDKLTFSSDVNALKACDVVYVALDIATDDDAQSDLAPTLALLDQIYPVLGEDAVLVINSQVPPGFTRNLNAPVKNLYYQVETLIFGQAVERALHPERFIIGCAAPDQALPDTYETYLDSYACPLLPMRYESAELAKISINVCLVASVTVANTMAELCENIGADWSEIVPALKLDKRIGPHSYLKPGLGIAGGNLERDLTSVINMSNHLGSDNRLIKAFKQNSVYRKDWALRTLHKEVLSQNPKTKIAVLGLAYKENTHSIKNSPALALVKELNQFDVEVYDPLVKASAAGHFNEHPSWQACLQGADVCVIMTPWAEFKDITFSTLTKQMNAKIVLDPYGVLNRKEALEEGFTYLSLGVK